MNFFNVSHYNPQQKKKKPQSNLHCHQLDVFYEEDAIESSQARRTFSEKLSQ